MAIAISEILISQSFGVVVQRVNDIADAFTANVVTTGALPGGAYTTGNAYVNGMFGANTLYATTIAGGNISTNTALYVSSNTYVNNYLSVGNNTINASFGYVSGTQAIGSFYASTNSFVQTTTTNVNTGISASADWVAYNDVSDGSVFIDMGIVSSMWANTQWTIGGANDGYLYTGGGNLSIGTNSSSKYINFFTNGGFAENERMRITSGGNVGIHNTAPDATLAVTGTANVSANVRIGGYTTIANSFNVLSVDSNLIPKTNNVYSLGNSSNRWASLYVSGSTIYLGTVSLSDSSGSLQTSAGAVINGGLTVNSSIVGANTISITGNSTFANTIAVTGNSTFANTIAVTGSATFSNTMAVTGATTLSNILNVTGAATLSNSITTTGYANVGNTLNVTGASTFGNTLNVTGATSVGDTLAVGGPASFSNSATVYGAVTLSRSLSVGTTTTMAGTLTVTGAISGANSLTITGYANVGNTLAVVGNVNFSNTLAVTGSAVLSNTLAVTGAVTLSNTLSVTNTATFSNTVSINGAVTTNSSITANGGLTVNGAVSITNSSLNIATNSGVTISVGNSTVNTSINSISVSTANIVATKIAGTLTTTSQPNIIANNALYLNGNTASTLLAAADAAYTNAIAYACNQIGLSGGSSQTYADGKAAAAYTNAVSYTDTTFSTISNAIVSASANATNLTTGTLLSGRISGSYTGITAVGTLATLSANVITTNSVAVANSLTVGNNITVSGNSTVTGNSVTNGNAWLNGDLRVSGNLYITGTTASGSTAAGDLIPTSNSILLGNNTNRFILSAMSGSFVQPVTVTNTVSFGNTFPLANGVLLGNSTLRWAVSANTIDVSSNGSFANITVTTNSTLNIATINTAYITGVTTHLGNSSFAANSSFAGIVTVSNNATVSGNVSVANYLSMNNTSYNYSTKYNVSGTTIQTADTFDAAAYRSAEYTIQMTDTTSTSYQVSKLLLLHDGTTPLITEYAQLYNNSLLGTFSADINGGFVRLRLTPTTGTVVVTLTRTGLVL